MSFKKQHIGLQIVRTARVGFEVGLLVLFLATSVRSEYLLESSRTIDQLVANGLRENEVQVNEVISDEVFVRRVYLDITGMIPGYAETKAFLESPERDKRTRLIDQLLNSEGYVHHFSNYWGDILRIHTKQGHGELYRAYLKVALRENLPYDDLVGELITAEGGIWQNGAAGFYLRDAGMPLDHMSNLTQVFLGTRIGCAQCHDHPFDEWTQKQFYEMTAFTFGAKTGFPDPGSRVNEVMQAEGLSKDDPEGRAILSSISEMVKYGGKRAVHDYGNSADLHLPHDYQYDDGQPGDPVPPRTMFGDDVSVEDGKTSRESLVDWMTSNRNDRFSRVVANRLWKKVMGRGLVEPVDDFNEKTAGINPPLLDFLAEEMIRLDYDMKAFLRMIYNTSIYQREATPEEAPIWEPYYFQGPVVRRMSGEQVWDSMLKLAIKDPLERLYVPQYEPPVPDYGGMSLDEIYAVAKADPGIASGGRDFKKFLSGLNEGGKGRRDALQKEGEAGYGDNFKGLYLSSQLPMPMPPSHFLREFGQSDREMIEAGNQDPTVPQVLNRLNGSFPVLLSSDFQPNKKSKGRSVYLPDQMAQAKSTDDRLEILFLSVLTRHPDRHEVDLFKPYVSKGNWDEVLWVLLNSHEFLFVR